MGQANVPGAPVQGSTPAMYIHALQSLVSGEPAFQDAKLLFSNSKFFFHRLEAMTPKAEESQKDRGQRSRHL